MSHRSVGKLAGAAAATAAAMGGLTALVAAPAANASVVVDIRATQLNGAPVADPKLVVVGPGDVVTFDIFATVTGTNGLDDEGFQQINGAIRSSTGGLLGDLQGSLVAPFNGAGSTAGSTIDIDSDGDLDVSGSNPQLPAGYWSPRNAAGFSTDGQRIGTDSEQFLIGGATFTVTAAELGNSTIVDYFEHRSSTGGNLLGLDSFLIDGNSTGPRNAVNTPITSAGGVTLVAVPEPAGPAVAGIAALGLLSRRKKSG